MKLSIAFMALVISSVSFANVPNDITLSNLPTASKEYSQVTLNESDVAHFKSLMEKQCSADKKAAEAFVLKSGSKILSTAGCEVKIEDSRVWDQGADLAIKLTTDFKVLFK